MVLADWPFTFFMVVVDILFEELLPKGLVLVCVLTPVEVLLLFEEKSKNIKPTKSRSITIIIIIIEFFLDMFFIV